ncbi:hypothetical protein [Wolbachia endosymbiont of Trichogramma pretiosum]|nr:hypothetical protein [Wolbachia endosymbiont of Trichogramma pretiosum]OCA06755.1 hypothetical protein wTpre_1098 [Wolbachia endosymbiont of Trichogramma pretiosum]
MKKLDSSATRWNDTFLNYFLNKEEEIYQAKKRQKPPPAVSFDPMIM